MVVACDSVGGIGPKPADSYRTDAWTTGHFATRVPLLEVLCAGAEPLVVVNTLCVERDPTGEQMIDAVRALAAEAGVAGEGVLGSTEENVATRSTGIGITVIGRLREHETLQEPAAGDVVLCAGRPLSAPDDDVYPGHPDMVSMRQARAVLRSGLVGGAVPVGSKGIGWEVTQLAGRLRVRWRSGCTIDPGTSGGPSSCVLFSCPPENEPAVRAHFPSSLPVQVVAELVDPDQVAQE